MKLEDALKASETMHSLDGKPSDGQAEISVKRKVIVSRRPPGPFADGYAGSYMISETQFATFEELLLLDIVHRDDWEPI